MSIFDGPLSVGMSVEARKRKKDRDQKWRKAAAARKLLTAEEQEAERLRLQEEIDEILAAKRAA